MRFCPHCGEPVFGSGSDVDEPADVDGELAICVEELIEELEASEPGDSIESLPNRPLSVDEVDQLRGADRFTHVVASPPADVDEEGSR